jgi:cytochrome bd ubiquinol oxidase subunit I
MVSRLEFAFTVTYHYLFPMLTMGLALLKNEKLTAD